MTRSRSALEIETDRLRVRLVPSPIGWWAAYEGDRVLIQRLSYVEAGGWIDGVWWRPLDGALVHPGRCREPERLGRRLILTGRRWREVELGADFRYVWDDGRASSWLLPIEQPLHAGTVWCSVAWASNAGVPGGDVRKSMQCAYGESAPSGLSFAEALSWYERRRRPRQPLRPLLWLAAWVIVSVVFALSVLTPPQRGVVVPAVLGETSTGAEQHLAESGLRARITGGGTVALQSPGAGSVVPLNTTVRLRLRP